MAIQYPIPEELNQTWAGAQDWLKNLLGNVFDPNQQTQPPAIPGMQAPPQSLPELMAGMVMQGGPKEAYESGMVGMGPMPLAPQIPASLKGLASEAKKYQSFEEFEKAFLRDIKHGTYWHWTDDPNFKIDPLKGPTDMSSIAAGTQDIGKLMVTSDLHGWKDYGGTKGRPYAALIDLDKVSPKDYYQVNRGFGNEFFVNDPQNAQVIKVYPRNKALAVARERHKALPGSSEALHDFYKKVWEFIGK